MESSVIRVKRRITDEPFDKFVLNCKRAKMCKSSSDDSQQGDDNSSAATRKILKFAATINDADDITKHLTKLRKPEAEELAKKVRKPPNVLAKLRQQFKDDTKEQRYKVVNFSRSEHEEGGPESAEAKTAFTVFDVIKEEDSIVTAPTLDISPTNFMNRLDPEAMAKLDKFVYDLYFCENDEEATEINPNDDITIRPFDDLLYQRTDECLNESDSNCSEDSNEEGNYRNDYPDTDSDFSVKDNDIRNAVENLAISVDETSSDDDYVHGNDPSGPVVNFVEAEPGDEFNYFKKFGQIRKYSAHYRNNRRRLGRPSTNNSDTESDTESDPDDNLNETSSSSSTQVSPLMSCDENEDD